MKDNVHLENLANVANSTVLALSGELTLMGEPMSGEPIGISCLLYAPLLRLRHVVSAPPMSSSINTTKKIEYIF